MMTSAISPTFRQQSAVWLILVCGGFQSAVRQTSAVTSPADPWEAELQYLTSADALFYRPDHEHERELWGQRTQQAWRTITKEGSATDLPKILAGMKGAGPLGQNWVRAAADTIAERELRLTGTLPTKQLEGFVLDLEQPPRARRVAYEWLVAADATTPDRLLPQLLDDDSLELRYDAVSRLLSEAKQSDDEQVKLKKYQRALRSARDKTQLKECAERLKDLGETPDMASEMGFLTAWRVSGPFDNTDRTGFDKPYPPEQTFGIGVDFGKALPGKHGSVRWQEVTAAQQDLEALGFVDLNSALAEEKSVLAYAWATFVVETEQSVQFRYESKQATKLWVNGDEIAAKRVYHSGSGFDQYIVPGQLKRGENQILIKVCQNEQTEPWTQPWEFRLRITDQLGGAIAPATSAAE